MSTQASSDSENVQEFTIVFKKDALLKLKELARFLDIPEKQLGDVLVKGLHVIDMARNGKVLIEREKECFEVDVKKL